MTNYPFDGLPSAIESVGVYSQCPDDATFRAVSLAYSKYNTEMYQSSIFKDGVCVIKRFIFICTSDYQWSILVHFVWWYARLELYLS